MHELSDYLKANCRSYENDCDNELDTMTLTNHLHSKFPELSFEEVYEQAKHWTGYKEEIEEEVEEPTKLFINIEVQDGERRHSHKCLIATKCKNIDFAVTWYVAHFWGIGERDGDWWNWWGGEIAGRLYTYNVLTEAEYSVLKKFLI